MIYLRLFFEFFKTGLFAVGGGLATLPFLYEMGENTGWFTAADVADMMYNNARELIDGARRSIYGK